MSTSSRRQGSCKYCGHVMNEHASKSESKCKNCQKDFYICQAPAHGNEFGWRLCSIPCSCGWSYYPDKAKAAKSLKEHEYQSDHPAYRPQGRLDETEASDIGGDAVYSTEAPTQPREYVDVTWEDGCFTFTSAKGVQMQTKPNHWKKGSVVYEGVQTPCSQWYKNGTTYWTWTLPDAVPSSKGKARGHRGSYGKQKAQMRSRQDERGESSTQGIATHKRTLSEESDDPLHWTNEEYEMFTTFQGLSISEAPVEESRTDQAETSIAVSSARIKDKLVIVTLPDGGKKETKRKRWQKTPDGYYYESKSDGVYYWTVDFDR